MPLATAPDEIARPPRPSGPSRGWSYWKIPVLCGFVFCALQVGLFLARFGLGGPDIPRGHMGTLMGGMLSGLGLFFIGGLLAALTVRGLLRGAEGRWRICLIVLAAAATPIALLGSLAGGLLGPPLVVLYATIPYLIFVGFPVLGHRLWLLRGEREAGS